MWKVQEGRSSAGGERVRCFRPGFGSDDLLEDQDSMAAPRRFLVVFQGTKTDDEQTRINKKIRKNGIKIDIETRKSRWKSTRSP